jgi:aryl-alcohol dehydrogenase-like predicted oxidoreductase
LPIFISGDILPLKIGIMQPSKICLGTVQLGMAYGINNRSGKPSFEESRAIIETALNSGIRTFDTAPAYGDSESILGECLGGARDGAVIVSKISAVDWSLDRDAIVGTIRRNLETSLVRLRIPAIPVYLFHRFPDVERQDRLALEEIRSLKKEGLIGKIGVSIYTPDEAEAALSIPELEAIQVPFHLLDKRLLANGFLGRTRERGVLVFSRSVFLQGLFFRESVPPNLQEFVPLQRELKEISLDAGMGLAELALRFVLSKDAIDSVLVGVERVGQLNENIRIWRKGELSEETLRRIVQLQNASDRVNNPTLW